MIIDRIIVNMGPAKIEMGSVLFLAKCVGFEPFYKVGPVILL